MQTIDLKKEWKELYNPSAKAISIVDAPVMNFLMIDGRGDPNSAPEYAAAVESLYAVAYALKFKVKKSMAIDYGVMPLEGLWWVDDMRLFDVKNKGAWQWTMMIAQPEFVTADLVTETIYEVKQKKDLPLLPQIRFAPYHEGPAAQILYIGPYADEGPTIAQIHATIGQRGHTLAGKHHEIYLSDPRKTAPEKLKTIIRQPFKSAA
jgi:hypothetical protein